MTGGAGTRVGSLAKTVFIQIRLTGLSSTIHVLIDDHETTAGKFPCVQACAAHTFGTAMAHNNTWKFIVSVNINRSPDFKGFTVSGDINGNVCILYPVSPGRNGIRKRGENEHQCSKKRQQPPASFFCA